MRHYYLDMTLVLPLDLLIEYDVRVGIVHQKKRVNLCFLCQQSQN